MQSQRTKYIIFITFYMGFAFLLGIVLPIYLLHIQAPYRAEWFNLLPLCFIISWATVVDITFAQKYTFWKRSALFIMMMAIGFCLSVVLIRYGHQLLSH